MDYVIVSRFYSPRPFGRASAEERIPSWRPDQGAARAAGYWARRIIASVRVGHYEEGMQVQDGKGGYAYVDVAPNHRARRPSIVIQSEPTRYYRTDDRHIWAD